jgi:hypothetical protein
MGKWAQVLLEADPLFSKMAAAMQEDVVKQSVQFGKHIGEKTREKLGEPGNAESIRLKLVSLGCGVRVDDENDQSGPMSIYEEDLLTAKFFTFRIRRRAFQKAEQALWNSGWYELYSQCVAREMFRHIENTLSGKVSHHVRLKERLWGLFPVTRPVETSRDIANIAFIQTFLSLDEPPLLMLEP